MPVQPPTREALHAILDQLDQAILSHEDWFAGLNRALVCRLPPDPRNLAKDAHRECRFGQWYYGDPHPCLQDHPAFAAIEYEHALMHRLAAQVLNNATETDKVNTEHYDHFAGALDRLRLQITTLKRELMDSLFNLDPLTGTNNRVGLLTRLRELQELVRRKVEYCSIAMFDLDKFKRVNDSFGHTAGDEVLKTVARYLLDNTRPYDTVFRYGGEEFLLAMQNTDVDTAYRQCERLRAGIATLAFDLPARKSAQVTTSVGVAALDPDVYVEKSIERADRAMYAAKATGRDRVHRWTSELGQSPAGNYGA